MLFLSDRCNVLLGVPCTGCAEDPIKVQRDSATIVFPHFGDRHKSADIFKRTDAIAAHPNAYLDTSGYGHDRVGMLEYAVKTIGPDRVLSGPDFSINCPPTVSARAKNAFITEEQQRKILSGNLPALLKRVQT